MSGSKLLLYNPLKDDFKGIGALYHTKIDHV